MWKYVKKYIWVLALGGLCMVVEVMVDLIQPSIMSDIVDNGVLGVTAAGTGDMNVILKDALIMLGLIVAGFIGGSLCSVFASIGSEKSTNDMRKDAFERILKFSFPQVDRFGTGSLITRITNDITQVRNMIEQLVRGVIRSGFFFVGSIVFMFILYPMYGLVALCALPVIVGVMILCMVKAAPGVTKMQEQLDRVNAVMQEDVTGIRIIKACVKEAYEKLRFGKANDELIGTQLHVLVIFALMSPAMNFLMYVVVILIIIFGAIQAGTGTVQPGAIMGAITYTTQLLNSILNLAVIFQNISKGRASWTRIHKVLNTENELEDGSFMGEYPAACEDGTECIDPKGVADPACAEHGAAGSVTDGKRALGSVEFRNVSFGYPGTNKMILHGVNLKVNPGETLAIMGATGCGKTSLVNLIPRFYDVTEGEILVDGVNVKEYNKQALRERVAITLQKSELFGVSAAENIRWGKLDATDEEIRNAARIAQADSFINEMPEGYDEIIAEKGMSLSGGQRQRMSIARTVLKDAEIYIFDDSTSALDLKTEAAFYEALSKAHPESTKIIVAQRIASIRNADRIAILENGTIIACAGHDELMQSSSIYQNIYNSQMGEEEQVG